VEELGGQHMPLAEQREHGDGKGAADQRAGDVDPDGV